MVREGRLHFWVKKAAGQRVLGIVMRLEKAGGVGGYLRLLALCFLESRCLRSGGLARTMQNRYWLAVDPRQNVDRVVSLPTFPTAASPSSTSLTLLVSFGAAGAPAESAMMCEVGA